MLKPFNLSLNFLQACLLNKAVEKGNKPWSFNSFSAGHLYLMVMGHCVPGDMICFEKLLVLTHTIGCG